MTAAESREPAPSDAASADALAHASAHTTVRLSVIVPVRDDSRLGACLASLARQTLERSAYEVLVIGERDALELQELVTGAGGRFEVRAGGAYASRAHGTRLARGGVLVFTDADVIVPPGWLEAIDRAFSDAACDAITGPSSSASGSRVAGWIQAVDEGRWARLRGNQDHAVVDTRNFAIRREILERVPFDPAFRQAGDLDLGLRLRNAGVRIRIVEAIRVTHEHPESLVEIVRREVRRGRGLARLDQKHGPGLHAQGERPLSLAGVDLKEALVHMARRPVVRWIVAGATAAGIAVTLPLAAAFARVPGRAADTVGGRAFVAMERASILLGRALGRPSGADCASG